MSVVCPHEWVNCYNEVADTKICELSDLFDNNTWLSWLTTLLLDEVADEEKDEADEKNRLISQVLELQNTLDGEW